MSQRRRRPLKTVADLQHDPLNANEGTQRGRALVETSVRRFGFGRSVLVDKRGTIIAGNKTVEAAQATGNPDVIVVPTTGKQLVVVQRTDLDLESDSDAKELAVADNRANEVGLSWNAPTLKTIAESGADLKQFWRQPEWDKLVAAADNAAAVGEEIPEMLLQPFEEYNYLMVVFRNSQDWQGVCDRLAIGRVAVTLGTTRKIGLGRVLDGAKLLEALCKSSSRAASGSPRSAKTPSRSSPKRRSVSARRKPVPTDSSPNVSSSTPTT